MDISTLGSSPAPAKRVRYFDLTKSPLYSVLVSLPLFLLYEIGAFLFLQSDTGRVGIGPEYWMKWLLGQVGIQSTLLLTGLVLVVGGVVYWRERKRGTPIIPKFLAFMTAESAGYAVTSGFVVSGLIGAILLIPTVVPLQVQTGPRLSFTQDIVLSLGAGLYEELFFRLILVTGLAWLLISTLGKKKESETEQSRWRSPRSLYFIAAVIGALIFSAVHYFGSMAYGFTFSSFLFRFLMGIVLTFIFVTRGFGVAALTHALFDVWVTILK